MPHYSCAERRPPLTIASHLWKERLAELRITRQGKDPKWMVVADWQEILWEAPLPRHRPQKQGWIKVFYFGRAPSSSPNADYQERSVRTLFPHFILSVPFVEKEEGSGWRPRPMSEDVSSFLSGSFAFFFDLLVKNLLVKP